MIRESKFGSNIMAKYEELYRDPVKWALMRNLAAAAIRDDIIRIIKEMSYKLTFLY